MKPYDVKTLRRKSLKELAEIGERDFGLKFNKSINKADRVTRILSKQTELAAGSQSSVLTSSAAVDEATPSAVQPGFSRLTDDEAPPPNNRGGARPGAGRPEGMTNEIAAMNRLSQQPHPFVSGALELLFHRWAASVKCPDVALTKDEAFALALAWTQVGDYLGVTEKIPVWLQLAITAIWTTANIVQSKAKIARDFKAQQKTEQQAEAA